ncbi:MAG: fibronectin type III domain-containing protein, partial [Candidatus Riflebacteria bacterium]|nr:fibronectin type III domain-containing protein [Candidatus Riflebacteria bacterium]
PTTPASLNISAYFNSTTTSPVFSWASSTDSISGISLYGVAIGTTPGANNLVWQNSGLATTFSKTGLALTNGTTYYVSVYADDKAYNVSSAATGSWTVDTATPTAPTSVVDGVAASSTTTSPVISWTASTDAGGVNHYEVAIGTSAGGTQTANWTNVGNATSTIITGMALTNGTTYYASIRAVDNASNVSAVGQGDGWLVDTTVPTTPGSVTDGVASTSTTSSPNISWTASTDTGSGINRYEIAIGTTAGGNQTLNWTSVGNVTNATMAGLVLTNGTKYYASVRAVDNASNASTVGQGDGWWVDTTAPTQPGSIDDGVATTSTSTSPNITWMASTDGASGINRYEVAIGTTAGGNQTLNWTSVGNVTNATMTSLTLATGTTYYASVRAVDNAGNVSAVGQGNGWVVSSTAPTVVNVTSTKPNGTYGPGSVIDITVQFSGVVQVTGSPYLIIVTSPPHNVTGAYYYSGTGSNTLTFRYTVWSGDSSPDLDYFSTTALQLNGGTIKDTAANNAILTLAATGTAGSLGANKALVIDAVGPTISNVTSTKPDGTYQTGTSIDITVQFSKVVQVTGTPQLTLETGAIDRAVNYFGGNGSTTLTFRYTVQASDTSPRLDYLSTTALALNGGTIKDMYGNDANLVLVTPGTANSLSANKALVIGNGTLPPGHQYFTCTGDDQYFTVPASCYSIVVKMWGAGGGGGYCHFGRNNSEYNLTYGGGGGYVAATLAVTPGEQLQVRVGGGGHDPSVVGESSGGWPNGGTGRYNGGLSNGLPHHDYGGGGGSSSILRGSTVLIEAGGGGGGSHPNTDRTDGEYAGYGGPGGGIRSGTPCGNQRGQDSPDVDPTDGYDIPGAGGGGYIGGLSGNGDGSWGQWDSGHSALGQGGSSYIPGGGTEIAANLNIPAKEWDPDAPAAPDESTAGTGIGGMHKNGGNGAVAITWGTPTGAPQITSVDPAIGNALDVEGTITINFDKPIMKGDGLVVIYNLTDGTRYRTYDVNAGNINVGGNSVTISLAGENRPNFCDSGIYAITVAASCFTGIDGTPFAGIYDTAAHWSIDGSPKISWNCYPNWGDTVGPMSSMYVAFNKSVLRGDSGKKIVLYDITSDNVLETIDVTDNGLIKLGCNVVTIKHDSPFLSGHAYAVLMDNGCFKDSRGDTFAGISDNSTWYFSCTDDLPYATKIEIVSSNEIDFTFSRPMGSGVMDVNNYRAHDDQFDGIDDDPLPPNVPSGARRTSPNSVTHVTGNTYRAKWDEIKIRPGSEIDGHVDSMQDTDGNNLPFTAFVLGFPKEYSPMPPIDMVNVGDAGNDPDTRWNYGEVDYDYRIGKYEITNDQYCFFLNAVAKDGDPNGLFYTSGGDGVSGMDNSPKGGIYQDQLDNGTYIYTVKRNMGNRPAAFVSPMAAMRFTNWLHNGAQIDGDTEDGAYSLSGAGSRNGDATYFIPTENEWYKAAYFDPTKNGGGGYWMYATRTDSASDMVVADVNDDGSIGNDGGNVYDGWGGSGGNIVMNVGAAGDSSASYYGTFDQTGNLDEFMESTNSADCNFRGGSWDDNVLGADWHATTSIDGHGSNIGFRIGASAYLDYSD